MERALKRGADYIATGHYVKKYQIPNTKYQLLNSKSQIPTELRIAKDLNKDQSYFLYTLTQKQLAHSLFPLGNMTKPEVRQYAKKIGLPNWNRKDSQGVCFIGKIAMKDFLKPQLTSRAGQLLTSDGTVVGTHEGAQYYTVGQRHGIGYGGGDAPTTSQERYKKEYRYGRQGTRQPRTVQRRVGVLTHTLDQRHCSKTSVLLQGANPLPPAASKMQGKG